jgi:hypothetical protein
VESEPDGVELTIELVPRSVWDTNLRKLLPAPEWDRIRKCVYAESGYRCGICGAAGRLSCHERWEYDDERGVQKLLGFIALCHLCHLVKHLVLAGNLAHQGRLDYEAVVQHFMKVNRCDRATFEEREREAFAKWRERSSRPWQTDLGEYRAVVRLPSGGSPCHPGAVKE